MDILLHLDSELSHRLAATSLQRGKPIDAVVLEVLRSYLPSTAESEWPPEVLSFKGVPDMPPFESYRSELVAPKDDPFV